MTDSRSLIYLFKYSDPNSRIYRWQLTILEFHIEDIAFIVGENNIMADYLSRNALQFDPMWSTPILTSVIKGGGGYTISSPRGQLSVISITPTELHNSQGRCSRSELLYRHYHLEL